MATSVTFAFEHLPVANLVAHNGTSEVRHPEMIEQARTNGLPDPIHIRQHEHGPVPADRQAVDLLAVAVAAELETVPITYRPMIRVSDLTPHAKNAREDLHIDADFVDSFRRDGCRVALLVQRLEDGTIQVNDGHRRYYGAKKAGISHVPYGWDQRTPAEQHLDMVTTARHAQKLHPVEEAAALFEASQAGADIRRIAKTAGRTQKDTRIALSVGSSTAAANAAKKGLTWSFEDYAALADLEQADPDAAARVTAAANGRPHEARWALQRERTAHNKRAQIAAHRAELETAGARIVPIGELSDKARPLHIIGEDPDKHAATCQGHVWTLPDEQIQYRPYCANVVLYGHVNADALTSRDKTPAKDSGKLKAVKAGNLDWDAATEMRRRHVAQLIQRRDHKRTELDAMLATVTTAMYGPSFVLHEQMHKGPTTAALAEFLGLPTDATRADLEKKAPTSPKRAPVMMLARWAACHESRMLRNVWRTDDQQCRENRVEAVRYLTALRDHYGYEPTPIEAAVLADQPYSPEAPAPTPDPLNTDTDTDAEQGEELPTPDADAPEETEEDADQEEDDDTAEEDEPEAEDQAEDDDA